MFIYKKITLHFYGVCKGSKFYLIIGRFLKMVNFFLRYCKNSLKFFRCTKAVKNQIKDEQKMYPFFCDANTTAHQDKIVFYFPIRCFATSNSIIPVATETFNDSMLPNIGIRTFLSQRDNNCGAIPSFSLPIRIHTGFG